MTTDKGLIRSQNRVGTRSGKVAPPESRTGRLAEPTICERCGASFSRRAWRSDRTMTQALLSRARWTICPACKQVESQEYFGRVLLRGAYLEANEDAIRQRIENVTEQGRKMQPQRRLVSIDRDAEGLEVLTTSQKLAHRIVAELKKTFRGRASYFWADDGSLYATWQRDDVPRSLQQAR
jgi:NMD protein affecting ribosome stability and mRNA decay